MRFVLRCLVHIAFLSIAVMTIGTAVEAAGTVGPGSSIRLDADGCDEENYRCAFPCLLDSKIPCLLCSSSCDGKSENTANARIATPLVLLSATFHARSAPFTEFEIEATSETVNDPIVCAVDYDIGWKGSFLGQSFLGNTGSEVLITLELKDMTTGKLVKSEILHRMQPENGIGIKGSAIGAGTDKGEVKNQTLAMVRRGHKYRLTLKLDLESWGFNIPFVPDQPIAALDYMTGGQGAWWNLLRVTVEKDAEDLIANHGHTYLTGRGVGHNNTEAITGIAIFFDDSTDVADASDEFFEQPEGARDLPEVSTLRPNYPNPANPMTTVAFSLPEASHVSIRLFDVSGREVMTLVDEERRGGNHEVVLDASRLPSGIYFYRLTAGQYVETRKLVVAK